MRGAGARPRQYRFLVAGNGHGRRPIYEKPKLRQSDSRSPHRLLDPSLVVTLFVPHAVSYDPPADTVAALAHGCAVPIFLRRDPGQSGNPPLARFFARDFSNAIRLCLQARGFNEIDRQNQPRHLNQASGRSALSAMTARP